MFIVWTPPYTPNSYGNRILYSLAERLTLYGFEALTFNLESNAYLSTDGSRRAAKHVGSTEDIVIYPEIVSGNPLGSHRVVRYLLNNPYATVGQGVEYSSTDLLVTYSSAYAPSLPLLFLINDDRALLDRYRGRHKMDQVAVYFGKGDERTFSGFREEYVRLIDSFSQVKVITRAFPSRGQSMEWIAESKLVISFDPASAINYESTLLDTPALLVGTGSLKERVGTFKGIFYRIEDLDWAQATVYGAYGEYCDHISAQEARVDRFAKDVMAHFDRIERDSAYEKENSEKNINQSIYDRSSFNRPLNEKKRYNIDFPWDLPKQILKSMRWKDRARHYRIKPYKAKHPALWPIVYLMRRVNGYEDLLKRFYVLFGIVNQRFKRVRG